MQGEDNTVTEARRCYSVASQAFGSWQHAEIPRYCYSLVRGDYLNSGEGPAVCCRRSVVDINEPADDGRRRRRLYPIGVTGLGINPLVYENLAGHRDSGDSVIPIMADRKDPTASRGVRKDNIRRA